MPIIRKLRFGLVDDATIDLGAYSLAGCIKFLDVFDHCVAGRDVGVVGLDGACQCRHTAVAFCQEVERADIIDLVGVDRLASYQDVGSDAAVAIHFECDDGTTCSIEFASGVAFNELLEVLTAALCFISG